MNNLLAPFYEFFFDYNVCQDLLNAVFDNLDYGKICISLIVVPAIILGVFYKFWDPLNTQRLKWGISLIIIAIVAYSITNWFLYNNSSIQEIIGNYNSEENQVDPNYFIFQMGMISILYSIILSFIPFTFIYKRLSTNNSHNPF
jgi:formate hydrogenlyase subunit 3/multisubunit Na+/H+ antiporter MnhD subunit